MAGDHDQMVYHFRVPDFAPESDRIADQLRNEVIDGLRAPGSRLVERELAAEMGVSRVPVREALKILVAEGLATPRPRSWTVVRRFTERDIDDLIEVRSALEPLAFRLAAERGSAPQLIRLAEHLRTEQTAATRGDARSARRAGADFHETVVEMAGNQLLAEVFARTRARMRWLLSQHSELVEMADEHVALYDALADRDGRRAASLAADHLLTSRRAALAHHLG